MEPKKDNIDEEIAATERAIKLNKLARLQQIRRVTELEAQESKRISDEFVRKIQDRNEGEKQRLKRQKEQDDYDERSC